MRSPYVPLLLGACATIALGCGSSGSSTGSSATAPTVHAQTVTHATTPRSPLGQVRQRLAVADLHAETNAVSGAALGSLVVGDVTIYAYRNPGDATRDLHAIEQAFAEHPGRGLAKRVGAHVYFVAEQRALTAADRARFAKVIALGEAQSP